MSKRLLFSIIILLIITNIATLLMWNKDGRLLLEEEGTKINRKQSVASVDGQEISYQEWQSALLKKYGKKQLKKMVDQSVVNQLAEKKDITIHEKVIERELALLKTTQGVVTEDDVTHLEKDWIEQILNRYQLEALLTEDIHIPEQEIRSFYDRYHEQYNFVASMQYSHIIVQNNDKAHQVIKELDDGASFQLLAQEYSLDEDTKNNGGYIGFLTKDNTYLPHEYYEVAEKMDVHSYSEPISLDQNVAIIYLHQALPEVRFTYDEIKPHIERELALEKSGQFLDAESLWNKLDVDWVYDE